jgi:hypothetical protein
MIPKAGGTDINTSNNRWVLIILKKENVMAPSLRMGIHSLNIGVHTILNPCGAHHGQCIHSLNIGVHTLYLTAHLSIRKFRRV